MDAGAVPRVTESVLVVAMRHRWTACSLVRVFGVGMAALSVVLLADAVYSPIPSAVEAYVGGMVPLLFGASVVLWCAAALIPSVSVASMATAVFVAGVFGRAGDVAVWWWSAAPDVSVSFVLTMGLRVLVVCLSGMVAVVASSLSAFTAVSMCYLHRYRSKQ